MSVVSLTASQRAMLATIALDAWTIDEVLDMLCLDGADRALLRQYTGWEVNWWLCLERKRVSR